MDDPNAADHAESLDRMLSLNVRSVSRLVEFAVPAMAATGGGSFVVISSIAGLRGNRVLAGYGVTKAANAQMSGTSPCMGQPRRPGDRDLARRDRDRLRARGHGRRRCGPVRLAKTPLGRFGSHAEVAGAVVLLASPAGAFVPGQNIVIDGGSLVSD